MSKTLLITGASGFIGRNLARLAQAQGYEVFGTDLHPADQTTDKYFNSYVALSLPDPKFADFLRRANPDFLIHCAGMSSVPLSVENPEADFQANVSTTFFVLNTLRMQAPRCRFVFLSSAAVYGNPKSLPITESATLQPISPYGFHKSLAEQITFEHAALHGMSTASARIFSAYGPGLNRQVLWDICQKAWTSKQITLAGTGEESRDFIHVDDIAEGLLTLADIRHSEPTAQRGAKDVLRGDVYNLATGVETTVASLANKIVKNLAKPVKIEFSGKAAPGMPRNWRADITKIGDLGFKPRVAFDEGLKTFTTWFVDQVSSK